MVEASNDAERARQLAENLETAAEVAAQGVEDGSVSSQQADETASQAQSAVEEAEQLDSQAEVAEANFENAQELANSAQQAAEIAGAESAQASQQAKLASNLANAAEQLLEDFPEPFSPNLGEENLPGAAMALNEASDTLESQIEALENLQSGEPINPESIASNNPSEQGSSEFANSPAEDTDSNDFPFSSSTPFANPEVSEVLAQTLDSLDQAIFENENPFTEAQGEVAEATSSLKLLKVSKLLVKIRQANSPARLTNFLVNRYQVQDQALVDLDNRVLWPLHLRPWRLHCNLFNSQLKHTPKPWLNNEQK